MADREPVAVDIEKCIEPVDLSSHSFKVPTKEIKTAEDITSKWEKSEAYRDLLSFICFLNEAVKNKKTTDSCHVSTTTEKLLQILDQMDHWIDEIPPATQPQRFGNKAFRDWFKKFSDNADGLLYDSLESKFHKAIPEVAIYLTEGVGNSTRIDYGTGHEMAFIAFLLCLFKIGALTKEDSVATVCRIFARYLKLMRKIQMTYRLEPAGSQGVWNLDDHQFVPFIWGSSQLLDHPRIKPKSFVNTEICDGFAKDFLFLECIQFINKVKTGPFAEHSNQLWNISGVQNWGKVNGGLIKMYRAEVLAKYPVIQHFLFGSLLRINSAI